MMVRPKSWSLWRVASSRSTSTSTSVANTELPIEPSAEGGSPGIGSGGPGLSAEAPGAARVLDERLRLVLHQHVEPVDARVDEVAEHVVDEAVARAEGHRGLAPRAREGLQAVAPPSRHHDPENAGHVRQ